MPWIILKSPEKSPWFTNHLSSMHPKVNTQLKNQKWWVPLRSALYLFFFWSDLCQYLSISSTRYPTDKTLKETFHFFKTKMLHPSTSPIPNAKLKRVSKFIMWFTMIAWGKTLCYRCRAHDTLSRPFLGWHNLIVVLLMDEELLFWRSEMSLWVFYLVDTWCWLLRGIEKCLTEKIKYRVFI